MEHIPERVVHAKRAGAQGGIILQKAPRVFVLTLVDLDTPPSASNGLLF